MKKSTGIIVIIAVVAVIVLWGVSKYNGMVKADETVTQAWGNVENAYQRRSDLIPNLVNTVKGAANFEKSTLAEVVEARAAASQAKIDASSLTEENMAAFQAAQENLSGALSRLLVTVEAYPELKATANFSELQAQLEGTENRINVERKKFNDAVMPYNSMVRRFPGNIIAKMFGFDVKAYFKAEAGSEKAPTVEF